MRERWSLSRLHSASENEWETAVADNGRFLQKGYTGKLWKSFGNK